MIWCNKSCSVKHITSKAKIIACKRPMIMRRRPMRDGSNQLAIPTAAKSGPEYFMNRAYGDKQRQYFSRAFLTWRSIKASGYKHE
ncbi:hypothetical protein Bca4012_095685 [Brassica carinata]